MNLQYNDDSTDDSAGLKKLISTITSVIHSYVPAIITP